MSDVPQGTVFGPLLFPLYINDIADDIDSKLRLFTDDCACYRGIKASEDRMKLQQDINLLGCCSRSWDIRFKSVKCNIMQITRNGSRKPMVHIP